MKTEDLKFDIPKIQSSIIKVIGVGGGGSNAVNHMYEQGIKGVEFAICNTDSQSLELSPVPNRIQLGSNLTEGRGAGSDPEVGKNAAMENLEDIKNLLMKETKMLFITAGMGGGTGTGAAPIIAKAARDMGILTVGIVTTPFTFEGLKRRRKAIEGIEQLKANVDTLLLISNEKLREIYGNLPLSKAFGNADEILSTAAKGIAEIITVPGYINVDFEDVRTTMANSGAAIMGSGTAEGEDRALKAVEQAIKSPLLDENDIQGAKYILLNITSGTKEILMDEISIITDYIQEEVGLDADMIWGHCYDESLSEKISVTIIATAFEGKHNKSLKEKPEKVVRKLDEKEPVKSPTQQMFLFEQRREEAQAEEEPRLVSDIEAEEAEQEALEQEMEMKVNEENVAEENDDEKQDQQSLEVKLRGELARKKRDLRVEKLKRLSFSVKTDLDQIESEPAFKRRNVQLDKVPHSSDSNISRYSLEEKEEKPEIRPSNGFLHDNVD
ncbi:MAG: cell division protein FtsZ [Bacteroidia bacterium]